MRVVRGSQNNQDGPGSRQQVEAAVTAISKPFVFIRSTREIRAWVQRGATEES